MDRVSDAKLARKIADRLFTDGTGRKAAQLRLYTGYDVDAVYMAGWSYKPVVDLIATELRDRRKAERKAQAPDGDGVGGA